MSHTVALGDPFITMNEQLFRLNTVRKALTQEHEMYTSPPQKVVPCKCTICSCLSKDCLKKKKVQ